MNVGTVRRLLARAGVLALFAGMLTAAGAAPANAFDTNTCLWHGSYAPDGPDNDMYFDSGIGYWSAKFTIPTGARVFLDGQYPHSRALSYNVYATTASSTIASSINDVDIHPDADSSVNPFVAGNARNASLRNYTLEVVPGNVPGGGPATNTIYSGTSNRTVTMLMRITVPDAAGGVTGGVALPDIIVQNADNSTTTGSAACTAVQASTSALSITLPNLITYPVYALASPLTSPTTWQNTLVVAMGATIQLYGTIGNTYLTARLHRSLGTVVKLTGKVPTTPPTLGGDTTMGTGQVRYWSLCMYELGSGAVTPCVHDQIITTDSSGNYTIAVSRTADKPSNATAACGKNWLQWSNNGNGMSGLYADANDGTLVLRNLYPDPSFTQDISDLGLPFVQIPAGGTTAMGNYLPTGTYTTKSGFEALGC
ncbi:MAG: hypothetical protein WBA97_06390 [Actinophytocola sp.]|uniref:hypothetical protein n=1 Tax=Actinophytocola sp. TaxID=1872138 RepID=UPI003C739DEB